jgi:hypothetical protein
VQILPPLQLRTCRSPSRQRHGCPSSFSTSRVQNKSLPVPLCHIGQGLPTTVEGYNGILVLTPVVTPVTLWQAGSGLPSATAPPRVNPGVLLDNLAAPVRAEAPAPLTPYQIPIAHLSRVLRLGSGRLLYRMHRPWVRFPLTVGPDVFAPCLQRAFHFFAWGMHVVPLHRGG